MDLLVSEKKDFRIKVAIIYTNNLMLFSIFCVSSYFYLLSWELWIKEIVLVTFLDLLKQIFLHTIPLSSKERQTDNVYHVLWCLFIKSLSFVACQRFIKGGLVPSYFTLSVFLILFVSILYVEKKVKVIIEQPNASTCS